MALATTKKATAYHEAGHAVAHCFLGVAFRKATIREGEDYLGAVEGYKLSHSFVQKIEIGDLSLRDQDRIDKIVMTKLAGPTAERRFKGRRNNVGATADYSGVVDFLFGIYSPGAVEAYTKFLQVRTEEFLSAPRVWDAVEAVAAALLDRETLDAKAVKQIYEEARFGTAEDQARRVEAVLSRAGVSA